MTPRSRTCRRSVVGLAVLFIVLGGFLAMHGVAATTATGTHHNPVLLAASSQQPMGADEHGSGDSGGHGDSHGLMVGCLLALVGLLVTVALRFVSVPFGVDADAPPTLAGRAVPRPPRPPPRRPRVSLCVIRV